MRFVVIDSDILVDYLRGHSNSKFVIESVESGKMIAYISSVTESELLAGKECDTKNGASKVTKLIGLLKKIDVNNAIAQKAGEFRRRYGIEIPDAIIGATAFHQKCKVWTKNIEDFKKIEEIEVEAPY